MDPLASRSVFDKIEALRGRATVVHITHDLAACVRADQVIMFEDGRLIESGTHDELVNRSNSKYRAFFLAHTGAEDVGNDDRDVEDDEDEDEDERRHTEDESRTESEGESGPGASPDDEKTTQIVTSEIFQR